MTGFNAFALSGRDCSYMGRPRVSLRLPWAECSIGLSGRPCKNHSGHLYARGWEAMLEPMHSLVTNCSVVEACVQVRAESSCKANAIKLAWIAEPQPMMSIKAQWSTEPRASEATPWVSRVGAVAPWKGKSITMCFRVLADTNNCKWMHVSQSDEGVNASTPTYM